MSKKPPRKACTRSVMPAAATAAAALLLLTACGSGTDGDTVTFQFWDNNAGPDRTPLWEHIIEEFEADNPDINVEYVGIPIDSVQQKYDTAIAGDSLPDVGLVSTAYLSNVAAREALQPLDDRIADSGLEEDLNVGFLENVREAGPDEQTYTVPTSANLGILWYRSDWFEEEGLDEPQTWEDFFEAAEALTDSSENRYGFTIRGGSGSIAQILDEMYAISGIDTFFEEDGATTLNAPENVEALERIAAMFEEQTPAADLNNDFPKMVAQFTGGDVAMLHHNLGSYSNHVEALGEDNVVGVPLFPSENGQERTIVSNPTDGIALFEGTDHPDESWRFIEFVLSAQMNSYWNENVGQIPANTTAAEDEWVQENEALASASEVMDDPDTTIVQLPYYLPEFNPITKTDMEPLFQQVLVGDLSAQEFLDESAELFEVAEAEYRERQ